MGTLYGGGGEQTTVVGGQQNKVEADREKVNRPRQRSRQNKKKSRQNKSAMGPGVFTLAPRDYCTLRRPGGGASRGRQGPACFHKGERASIREAEGGEDNQWGRLAIPHSKRRPNKAKLSASLGS